MAGQHPLFMADQANKNQYDLQDFPVSVYIQNQPYFWLKLMPSYISKLDKEPWRQVVPKVFFFFFDNSDFINFIFSLVLHAKF